jgi:long-chain acyl-CoA synthetase
VMLSDEARKMDADGDKSSLTIKMQKLLEEVNKVLAPFEQLAFLAIAKDVWSAENDFLTPTLKIKRQVLDVTYGPLAEKWYSTNQPVVWCAAGRDVR